MILGSYPNVENCSPTKPPFCRQCPDDTFMARDLLSSWNFNGCLRKKRCPENLGLITVSNGSRTQDRVCRCLEELGYMDYNFRFHINKTEEPLLCIKRRCPAMFQLNEKGQCERCPEGQVKHNYGYGECVTISETNSGHSTIIGVLVGTSGVLLLITCLAIGLIKYKRYCYWRENNPNENTEMTFFRNNALRIVQERHPDDRNSDARMEGEFFPNNAMVQHEIFV